MTCPCNPKATVVIAPISSSRSWETSQIPDDIVLKNDPWYARWDRFLDNRGHLLVILFRHMPDFVRILPLPLVSTRIVARIP